MEDQTFLLESYTPFSESMIWQLNRDYYQQAGIAAWSNGEVPHHMTSNAFVGKTYAGLILGLLKDLAAQGKTEETVYLLELGAGHGRLAFHILKYLEQDVSRLHMKLPDYCYVLSDIVEENLQFFEAHADFLPYYERGQLDVTYFDALTSTTIQLRKSGKTIQPQQLRQPIVAIANYFFDSIPNDLFFLQNGQLKECAIALYTDKAPHDITSADLLSKVELRFRKELVEAPCYESALYMEMLQDYSRTLNHTHLFFPHKGMQCLQHIQSLSQMGMMLLSMDKGFYDLADLDNREEPEIITHGSFSIWVNYHALGSFCEKQQGKVWFPAYSAFHLQIGCLLFVDSPRDFNAVDLAYEHYVNDFGPDDYNNIKNLTYENISRLRIQDLMALLRLSAYDSTFFQKILPRIKQVMGQITISERRRLGEAMDKVWVMYFSIQEDFDMAYEIGGILYDLGFYANALRFFERSLLLRGAKADIFYNLALCCYQLRLDENFDGFLNAGRTAFPEFTGWGKLEVLDLGV
jgi:SAM-dependent MidA family methyltransferase